MSQNYSNWPNEAGDERSQPRYQPYNVEPSRPGDWPAPDPTQTPDPGYIPPAQGNWGAYQPGAPVNGAQPYNYNGYPNGSAPPYNYNNYPPIYGGQPYNYNNYGNGDWQQFKQWRRAYRHQRRQQRHNYRYNNWRTDLMPLPGQPLDPRQLAEYRVNRRMAFYRHLKTYILVNAFLWFFALATLPVHAHFWPIYISFFWGIGLCFEYSRVFGRGQRQRQQMIEEEMRRLK